MRNNRYNLLTQNYVDTHLENEFRNQFHESSLIAIRWTVLASAFIHLCFLAVDYIVLTDYLSYQNFRIFVLAGASLVAYSATFLKKNRDSMQYVHSAMIVVNGYGMALGTYMYGEANIMYWSIGTVLVAIFGSMLMGLRFVFALTSIWVITIVQLYAIQSINPEQQVLATLLVLLVTTAVFLTMGSYVMERAYRSSFIKSKMLVENEKQRAELEQSRNMWLEQIASFLRHELRNAMNGAKTSFEMLKRSGEVNKAIKYLDRGYDSIKIMSSLLNSVSDATSIESSLSKDRPRVMSLTDFIQRYTDALGEQYADHAFKIDLDSSEFKLVATEERLTQLLDKLITNAIDHSDPDTEVTIKSRYKNDLARIEIINQGTPLPDDKEIIFNLFASFREHIGPDQKRGYGLYIARLIVDAYNGEIRAEDYKDKQGARFVVHLPKAR
jgi:signal transduction histidine kinase